MSFCRWGLDSDVYCYNEGHALVTLVNDGQRFEDPDTDALLLRVIALRDKGYRVPRFLIHRLTPDETFEEGTDHYFGHCEHPTFMVGLRSFPPE